MVDKSGSDNDKSNDSDKTNMELIYSYTENLIAGSNNAIENLNRKLTTFLGFSGVLLGFAIKLNQNHACPSSLLTKFLVIGLAGAAAIIAGSGLLTKRIGTTENPKALLDDKNFNLETSNLQGVIVNTWLRAIEEEYKVAGSVKQIRLNISIGLLMGAVVFVMLNMMLGTFLVECVIPN